MALSSKKNSTIEVIIWPKAIRQVSGCQNKARNTLPIATTRIPKSLFFDIFIPSVILGFKLKRESIWFIINIINPSASIKKYQSVICPDRPRQESASVVFKTSQATSKINLLSF